MRTARLKYEAFQDSVYASHPELIRQRRQLPEFSVNDLDDFVSNRRTTFLEYVVTKSKTYLFVLSKTGTNASNLKVHPIEVSEERIAERIREYREMLASQNPGFAETARQLYDLLLRPAEEQLKGNGMLCIIPDGPLWDLPFQAVQSRANRYLLEDHAIYYSPSLSVLKELSRRRKKFNRVSTSLLAFGNPQITSEIGTTLQAVYRSEILSPLPEAEIEVKALKEIWKPSPSRIFIGAKAGKTTFKTEAGKYRIIHLATHGILDNGNPMYSRLVMARSENDPDDDGMLEAREIMKLNLQADLVVLSACQTARGRFGAGEGMVGMSWAFLVAGVPTMVASQWKVDSASTSTLMIDFHKRLKGGVSTRSTKADALRQAALDLMIEPRYRHPFFWASFVLIGKVQ